MGKPNHKPEMVTYTTKPKESKSCQNTFTMELIHIFLIIQLITLKK